MKKKFLFDFMQHLYNEVVGLPLQTYNIPTTFKVNAYKLKKQKKINKCGMLNVSTVLGTQER